MTKICTKCNIEKDENDFTKGKTVCKKCRANKKVVDSQQNKINERIKIRDEFKDIICKREDMTSEDFNERFISKEEIAKRKNNKQFSFCDAPDDLKDEVRSLHAEDFAKKYIVDMIFMIDNDSRKGGLIFII